MRPTADALLFYVTRYDAGITVTRRECVKRMSGLWSSPVSFRSFPFFRFPLFRILLPP